jgi:hypothetical protein
MMNNSKYAGFGRTVMAYRTTVSLHLLYRLRMINLSRELSHWPEFELENSQTPIILLCQPN